MINAMQRSSLRRAIRRHVEAQVALSWKGSKMPAEAEYIERRAEECRKGLDTIIKSLSAGPEVVGDPAIMPEYDR